MQVVLDTVVVNHLLRRPAAGRKAASFSTSIDEYIDNGRLTVHVDKDGGIIDEWKDTCGREYIEALMIRWYDAKGLFSVHKPGRIPPATVNKLRQLGFDDTIDKLLLRVALSEVKGITDKIVVSNDSDFWNPANPNDVGERNAPVAKLLRDEIEVIVYTLKLLMTALRKK